MRSNSIKFSAIFFILLLILSLVSCGDDDSSNGSSSSDDDDDDSSDDDDDDDDNDDDNDDSAWDNLSDELDDGEVRAGVISSEDELIGGPKARGQIGDYKIYNSNIEFIISTPDRPGLSLTTISGTLIDADLARPKDESGMDCLVDLEHIIGVVRAYKPETIELVEDGHNGPAVIRTTGHDAGISFIDSFAMMPDKPLTIMNEYILKPDVNYLLVRTTVTNDSQKNRLVPIVDLPFWRNDLDVFGPRAGYDTGQEDPAAGERWIGGVDRLGYPVSYALATSESNKFFYTPYFYSDVLILVEAEFNVPPGGQAVLERIFIVGDGDTRLFNSTLNQYDGDDNFGTIEGTVTTSTEGDLESVKVLVQDTVREDGKNYVGLLVPDSDGKISLDLAPGDYTLTTIGEGREDFVLTPVTVTMGQKTNVTLSANEPGFLEIDVVDETANNIPCKITLQAGHDADPNAKPAHRLWSVSGVETFRVLPGSYTATISRGYEYEIYQENITINEGESTVLVGTIERSVDSTGLMSGEFHIHSVFSMDSNVLARNRVTELAGEGLEMPVMSDHDTQPDFVPYVEDLQAEAWVKPINGSEISPSIGHFNAWPLSQPEGASDYYSVSYMDYDETLTAYRHRENPEMWEELFADYGAQMIQINHPRGSSGCWFSYLDYDPTLGVSALDPNEWDPDFHAIEVFNGSENDRGTLADWFSFLDQGLVYTMNGNSDSHRSTSELGSPRNYFSMPTDDPSQAQVQDMIDAQLNQQSQVSSGPLITFTIEDQSIGGWVLGYGSNNVDLNIQVQAPSWMQLDYVKVFSNHGVEIFDDVIPVSTNVVRYDETITLNVAQDSYFVVKAGHTSARLGPVNPGMTTFAITNPIWVDVDGNGEFNEPGLPVIK